MVRGDGLAGPSAPESTAEGVARGDCIYRSSQAGTPSVRCWQRSPVPHGLTDHVASAGAPRCGLTGRLPMTHLVASGSGRVRLTAFACSFGRPCDRRGHLYRIRAADGPGSHPTRSALTTSSAVATARISFTNENWALAVTDATPYKGADVTLLGKIFLDPQRSAQQVAFQMYADATNNAQNTAVGGVDPSADFKRGDYVRVTGTVYDMLEHNC